MTTLLVIDIGNTNVSLGLFDYEDLPDEAMPESRLAQHWRMSTHREQTSDEAGGICTGCLDPTAFMWHELFAEG